ncbi:MAG: lytic transglycosylase domain-containing protein [Bdellovibrionota bacterium]
MFTASYFQNLVFVLLTSVFTYTLSTGTTSAVRPVSQRAFVRPPIELTERIVSSACAKTAERDRTTLVDAVQEASLTYELEPHFLLAVIFRESSCRMSATSRKGALGVMQIMPHTAKALGLQKPRAVRQNVLAGAKYLSQLLKQFDGNLYLALAAYNAGPATVRRYGKVPPYAETQAYVREVLKHYQELVTLFAV